MRKHLEKTYAMSEKGSKNLMRSIMYTSLQTLSFWLSPSIATYFLYRNLQVLMGTSTVAGNRPSLYLIAIVVAWLLMYLTSLLQYNVAYKVTYEESADLRLSIAEKLRELPMSFFGKRDVADLSSTLMTDINEIEQISSHSLPSAYASIISTSVIAVIITIYNWKMALSLLWVLPVAIAMFFLSYKFQKKVHANMHVLSLKIKHRVQENLDCIQEIKAHNLESSYSDEVDELLNKYESMLMHDEMVLGVFINLPSIILRLGTASVAVYGTYALVQGSVDIISLILFLVISANIYSPVITMLSNIAGLIYLGPRLRRMKAINNEVIQQGKTEMQPQNYDISFDNVKFSYEEDRQTIDGISFIAKQGEITALVGPSGGGKSTVAKLAARFWDIDAGTIKLGQEDIAGIDPEVLLEAYSIVFQDVVLFNNSILENIRIGRRTASDEEVIAAAKIAQCDDFIQKLPDKYNSMVGENGERLSGGERQRLSIARAILKDAPVILLDEATASLDAENESLIQRALAELIKNKTVLIIAHRMRTIINADKIVLLKDGKISEMGTPEELMCLGKDFKSMYDKQQLALHTNKA